MSEFSVLGCEWFETYAKDNQIFVRPKWIKVTDRLPPIGQRVLVYQKDGVHGGNEIDIEERICCDFWRDQGLFCGITHWMPLPTPPKDEE